MLYSKKIVKTILIKLCELNCIKIVLIIVIDSIELFLLQEIYA